MDSMRSLNTSLPGASTSPPKQQPSSETPGDLRQAFKAAALSITTLYKTALDDHGRSRAEGYQDAIDDLLVFLDKEDIGLSDGEGWRIRQWATERLDGRDSVSHAESEDEATEKAERGSSPVLQRSQSDSRLNPTVRPTPRTTSPTRQESSAPPAAAPPADPTPTPISVPQQSFTFRSTQPYPQDADIVLSDLNITDNNRTQSSQSFGSSAHSNNPGITITRPSRTTTRHNNHSRHGTRTSSTIGRGAGQKRKANLIPDFDFFDIGNLDYGKDGFGGGGKRGRFV